MTRKKQSETVETEETPDQRAERLAAKRLARGVKFVELANKRVPKTLARIGQLCNLSNVQVYTYTQDQAAKIILALDEAVDEVRQSFAGIGKTNGQWTM